MIDLISKFQFGKCTREKRTEKIMSAYNSRWAMDMEEDLLILGCGTHFDNIKVGCDYELEVRELKHRSMNGAYMLTVCETLSDGLQDLIINNMRSRINDSGFRVLINNYGFNMSFTRIGDHYLTNVKKIQRIYRDAMLDMMEMILREHVDSDAGRIITYEDMILHLEQMQRDCSRAKVSLNDLTCELGCKSTVANKLLFDLMLYYKVVYAELKNEGGEYTLNAYLTEKGLRLASELKNNRVMPPGVIIGACVEKQYGTNIVGFARDLDVTEDDVDKLLECNSVITDELAERLGRVFEKSPTYWKDLQRMYDDSIAQ